MQKENQTKIIDWRDEISATLHTKLKLADGETKKITFLDEGKRYKHPDFKPCIIFVVNVEGMPEPYTWFVNSEAYAVLNQIKKLGKLTGVKVELSRTGEKKSDTRYNIRKL
jgi:hypothetical protein